jgi:hypothetical protein
MPTISMFFGLIIRMYCPPKEHNPPHVHVYYQDDRASINILNGEVMEGNLPARQLRFVQTWIDIHREDLLANWALCQNREEPFRIDPLK